MTAPNGQSSAICRDCTARPPNGATSCGSCGSSRLYRHPKLFDLAVAHVDCDAFYALIEKRDNPELSTLPVIVGGGKRGVVSTCCYIARTYGVRSAMPMFKALKACPDAVVVKPRMDVYVREGRRIREMMQALTPLVEPVSIDEAYLDLSGTADLHRAPPAAMLVRLQKRVEMELGLTISVGLSANKFLAKTASEADKPRGFFAISLEEAPAYLAPRPVRIIGGVGRAFEARLLSDGIAVIADLQRAQLKDLVRRYGDQGAWLYECAFGRHDRPVDPSGERKSISAETTLMVDEGDHGRLLDIVWRLSPEHGRSGKDRRRSGARGHVEAEDLAVQNHHAPAFAQQTDATCAHAFRHRIAIAGARTTRA